ncbi:MAG: phenylalanine--tRNA ligase subunit beta [Actinomycetales bacterium mxb001]|nr:MAG: phenylalanine--tRNA ligase subunit beta [Actinomycetales bacterium mxb001]
MRVPLEWLRELVALPASVGGREVAERLIAAGLEVEGVEAVGAGVSGDLIVGRVESIEELTDFKKPIRWCQVDVGDAHGGVRGIVCGARNFSAGDLVVVALPGTVLPGDFVIASRRTYGHVSDGMICSERELGLGDNHDGIIVLDEGVVGDDANSVLGIGEEILDVAVTPDRGYALSMRGIAREVAIAFGLPFDDPGQRLVDLPAPATDVAPWPCDVSDPSMCDLFTLRRIVGFNPQAPTPDWMSRRLIAAGMRPVSLAVDVTNYVMLELGQPLHAFDGAKLAGAVRAGRAEQGERLETLDHVVRTLDADDVVIRDDSGAIGLAGTMGGLHTEIDDSSSDVVLEAARFVPEPVARTARRHRLSSEASRRFERGVDRVLAPYASARAAQLLLEHGGGTYAGMTAWESPYEPTVIAMPADLPGRTAGMPIDRHTVTSRLAEVGCDVGGDDPLSVSVPPWRPDLTDPADLVEEVVRLVGYDAIPAHLPTAPAGYGLTREQRWRRRVGLALAGAGFVDVLTYPFIGNEDLDGLLLAADDSRRRAPRLANPLSEEQPLLRTTLLPGLLAAARRNLSRGADDVFISEIGRVFLLRDHQQPDGVEAPPRPGVDGRPSDDELATLEDLLPDQPHHAAAVLSGLREAKGWWGPGRQATWSDAVDAAVAIGDALGVVLAVRQATDPSFHPGRTASLVIDDLVVGYAGELHPRVVAAFDLPPRTCAMEIDLDALIARAVDVASAPDVGVQPLAKEDIALVVAESVAAADVEQALRAGAGELCEDVRLFDVYVGPQVPEGHRSLAFALRLRAPDRTLSAEEISAAREAAIAEASRRHGAVLRG